MSIKYKKIFPTIYSTCVGRNSITRRLVSMKTRNTQRRKTKPNFSIIYISILLREKKKSAHF